MPDYVKYIPDHPVVPNIISGVWRSFPVERVGSLGSNVVEVVLPEPLPPLAKLEAGVVVALTQPEQDALNAANLAAFRAEVRKQAKDIFLSPQDPSSQAIKLGFETLIELTVQQINTLRTNAGLGTITANQVKNSFKTLYESKVEAL